jgi:DNA ligase (NAD+)
MFKTHEEELEFLKNLGFIVNYNNQKAKSLEEVWKFMDKLKEKKNNFKYQIDGVVVKLNSNELYEMLGIVGKTPRAWCALKYPAEETVSKLLKVSWQVGRTGKITPIADIDPVELQGTTIKKATLHNYKQVIDYDLSIGDLLVLRKAGDIIPEVVKVIKI